MGDTTRGGEETRGNIFGVEAGFERVPRDRKVGLRHRQRFARGYTQLPFHQIDARDRFGHRVFDLKAGVHLHEPEVHRRTIDNEFDRARTGIANRFCRLNRSGPHPVAQVRRHARCGRLFDDFLVTTLERTIPLEQMHSRGAITENLHLDVARAKNVFLDQDIRIAKRCPRLGLRRG